MLDHRVEFIRTEFLRTVYFDYIRTLYGGTAKWPKKAVTGTVHVAQCACKFQAYLFVPFQMGHFEVGDYHVTQTFHQKQNVPFSLATKLSSKTDF